MLLFEWCFFFVLSLMPLRLEEGVLVFCAAEGGEGVGCSCIVRVKYAVFDSDVFSVVDNGAVVGCSSVSGNCESSTVQKDVISGDVESCCGAGAAGDSVAAG